MNQRAFTLIELLVVVAIIGILAAVGVVAYNGYTNSAKVSVSKSNHSTAVKKLNLLIQECELRFFREYFTNDLNNSIEWKNNHTKEPWGRNYVAMSGNSWACTQEKYIGYVNLNYITSTKKIEICTCVDSPCSDSSNVITYTTQWE